MSKVARLCPLLLVLCAVGPLGAQAPVPLAEAVEGYLLIADEAEAAGKLDALLAREDATAERLLGIVKTPQRLRPGRSRFRFSHAGRIWDADLNVPPEHRRDRERLPVMMDIARGTIVSLGRLDGIVWVVIPQLKPPQFSDEGRDAFLKAARLAAFHGHGGPLWLGGYSWAGHATMDTILHRPGFARGGVPSGGGPRRNWFRLRENVGSTRIRAYVGGKEDPELVWNLREFATGRFRKMDFELTVDPRWGHNPSIAGFERLAEHIVGLPAVPFAERGKLLADGPFVENPLLRILEVQASRVTPPRSVRVTPSMTLDQRRKKVIAQLEKRVVSLSWRVRKGRSGAMSIDLSLDGVRKASVQLRASLVPIGTELKVRHRGRTLHDGPLAVDRRVLLEEVRRTGERLDPALMRLVAPR